MGSQLSISSLALLFNGSQYWYSCPQPNVALNQTFAPTPEANLTDCLAFALLSNAIWHGSCFAACPYNPTPDEHGTPFLVGYGYAAHENIEPFTKILNAGIAWLRGRGSGR
jgi:hypothetical protein